MVFGQSPNALSVKRRVGARPHELVVHQPVTHRHKHINTQTQNTTINTTNRQSLSVWCCDVGKRAWLNVCHVCLDTLGAYLKCVYLTHCVHSPVRESQTTSESPLASALLAGA